MRVKGIWGVDRDLALHDCGAVGGIRVDGLA